jgi:hypothetical protein
MLGHRSRAGVAALAGAVVLALVPGCGSGSATMDPGTQPSTTERPSSPQRERPAAGRVASSHCPAGLPSCRAAEGRITYVERVDPDGDDDAHFVIFDRQGITLPGLTAIDVRKDLRPHPLPEVGDLISAAGPVQTGSYGQSQIHALELHVADP